MGASSSSTSTKGYYSNMMENRINQTCPKTSSTQLMKIGVIDGRSIPPGCEGNAISISQKATATAECATKSALDVLAQAASDLSAQAKNDGQGIGQLSIANSNVDVTNIQSIRNALNSECDHVDQFQAMDVGVIYAGCAPINIDQQTDARTKCMLDGAVEAVSKIDSKASSNATNVGMLNTTSIIFIAIVLAAAAVVFLIIKTGGAKGGGQGMMGMPMMGMPMGMGGMPMMGMSTGGGGMAMPPGGGGMAMSPGGGGMAMSMGGGGMAMPTAPSVLPAAAAGMMTAAAPAMATALSSLAPKPV